MTAPAIDADGEVTGKANTVSTVSATSFSTASPDDVILAIVTYSSTSAQGPQSVINVTSPLLGAFTKRNVSSLVSSTPSYFGLEVWWAPYAPTLTNETVTATLTGTVDCVQMICVGISGTFNYLSPWDTNIGLPFINSGQSAPAAPSFSTTQASDIILLISMTNWVGDATSAWTAFGSVATTGPGGLPTWLDNANWYETVSAAQSGASPSFTPVSGQPAIVMVDALTASNNSSSLPRHQLLIS